MIQKLVFTKINRIAVYFVDFTIRFLTFEGWEFEDEDGNEVSYKMYYAYCKLKIEESLYNEQVITSLEILRKKLLNTTVKNFKRKHASHQPKQEDIEIYNYGEYDSR